MNEYGIYFTRTVTQHCYAVVPASSRDEALRIAFSQSLETYTVSEDEGQKETEIYMVQCISDTEKESV